ncbi:NAD(P)H-hydrate epimerase [Microbacterium sp. RURRCA19A]|uniref:NAD(P)H-hydrate epimerase n=1 Tax=Microbacterium sp. RURRCA19A TaxID=1907391 RepID=UPI00095732C2|nr:NAD(P)H-hydrate epimerase [Microbacterium sp. RURRCA19A]SIR63774.1 yjeF N-terminal region [Microbacterium sp. RURRCA19A]
MTERTVAYTADAIRAAEAPLLAAGRPLMREAARALAEVVADELARTPGPVLVLAGSGDNGGDALYAAADIARVGTRVDVVLTRDRVHRDALDAAVAAGAGLRDASDICGAHFDHVLVVDGILGIGASSDSRLRGTARAVVEALLPVVVEERMRVVAVDVPSGLHPDSGEADAAVLPATTTVTFGAVKAGLLRGHGPRLSGRLVLVDLGLEPQLRRVHPAVTAAVPVVRRAPAPWA